MEAAHTLLLQDYYSYFPGKKGAAKLICDSVDETYYKDLKHATNFYNSITAKELLLHLQTNCGGVEPKNIIALQTAMSLYYTKCNKEEVATILLLVINRGLTIYEIYGVPSYGFPRGVKRLAVIGPKYPLSLVA